MTTTIASSPARQEQKLPEQELDAAARGAMERAYDAADAGDDASAIRLCREVIARLPCAFAPHYLLGSLLARRNRIGEALAPLRMAVRLRPTATVALFNLGVALIDDHAFQEGAEALQRAHALDPNDPGIATALITALVRTGRARDANSLGDEALARWPGQVDLRIAVTKARAMQRDHAAALGVIEDGLVRTPGHPALLGRKARILLAQDASAAAQAAADAALAIAPQTFDALIVRGVLANKAKAYTTAHDFLRRAIALKPNSLTAHTHSISARIHSCDWAGLDRLRDEIEPWLARGLTPIEMFDALMVFDDPGLLQRIARTAMAAEIETPPVPACPAVAGDRRIRVGYLSSAFRRHASALTMGDMFQRHDRSRFEIIAFSTHADDGSEERARLRRDFDQFHDVETLTDDAAARVIRAAHLDVLVDRDGATGSGRFTLVRHRLAPVQVGLIGFAGTMGHPAWDYIVADRTVIPAETERFFDEAVVRLPDCYVATSARATSFEAPGRAACGLPADGVVFCAFNDPKKITRAYFEVWMSLLTAVPGSVLWILDAGVDAIANLRKAAAERGVDPGRLVVAPRAPIDRHMARHVHADLFLDTGPFNGHTTGADALFMGVPIVTSIGRAFHARVAASLLRAHGLPELVTTSLADYHALALALARDPTRLSALKARTRANRATQPLFDTARYVKNLEAAFERMVARHGAGLAPEGFDV